MRLVSFNDDGDWVAGVLVDDVVVPAAEIAADAGLVGDHTTVKGVIVHTRDELSRLEAAARSAASERGRRREELTLGPPVPDAQKILCVGANYQAHIEEAREIPGAPDGKQAVPIVFSKFATCLVGDRAPVAVPSTDDHLDFESELALVIGAPAWHVRAEDALSHVAGYMPFNDMSARQLQIQTPQWTMSKGFDRSGPCGPALVTADEIDDPGNLMVEGRLNGELLQHSSTSDMITGIADLIAYISSEITLNPGDIISTGTPSGVGVGREPKLWLKPGDVFEVTIEGLGTLTTPIVASSERP
jgi:acylpyruvate hydrolase